MSRENWSDLAFGVLRYLSSIALIVLSGCAPDIPSHARNLQEFRDGTFGGGDYTARCEVSLNDLMAFAKSKGYHFEEIDFPPGRSNLEGRPPLYDYPVVVNGEVVNPFILSIQTNLAICGWNTWGRFRRNRIRMPTANVGRPKRFLYCLAQNQEKERWGNGWSGHLEYLYDKDRCVLYVLYWD